MASKAMRTTAYRETRLREMRSPFATTSRLGKIHQTNMLEYAGATFCCCKGSLYVETDVNGSNFFHTNVVATIHGFHYQPRALRPNRSCYVNRREWHCYSASFGSRNTWKDVAWARHGTERLVLTGFTQMVHETRTTASSYGFRPLRREWSDIKPKVEE